MLEAAKAVITLKIEDTAVYRQLADVTDEIRKSLRVAGATAAVTGASITAAMGLAAAQAGAAAIQFRSVEAVLGDATRQAVEFARAIGDEVGRSVQSVTKEITGFVLQAGKMGLLKDQSVSMGAALSALGADIDAYFGESAGSGFRDLQSAIMGNNDVLTRFGIVLDDAAVAAQLLKMGLESGTAAATEQQMAIARQNAIMEQASAAGIAGEAASNAYAVAQGRLSQSFTNLSNAIGAAAKPGYDFVYNVLAGIMDYGSSVLDWITSFIAENEEIVTVVSNVAGAMTAFGGIVVGITGTIASLVGSVIVASAKMAIFRYVLGFIPVVGPIVLKVMAAIKFVLLAVAAAGAATVGAFAGVAAIVAAVGFGIYKLHKATGLLNPVLSAFASVGNVIADIWARVSETIGGAVGWLMKLVGLSGSVKTPAGGDGDASRVGASLTEEQQADTKPVEVPEELKQFAESQKESLKTPQQKFEDYIEKLTEMHEADLVSTEEAAALAEKARKARDETLRQEFEQSDAGKKAKEMEEFGKRLREETMTLEEKVADKIAKINEAVSADPTLKEAATRAIEAANKELSEAQAEAKKKADEASKKVREDQEKAIRDKFGLRADAAKAQGGDDSSKTAMAIQQGMIEALKAQGFSTSKDEVDHYGKVISSQQTVVDNADKMREQASVVTRSATEAASGLGSQSISQKQLDEAIEARRLLTEARDALNKVATSLEE